MKKARQKLLVSGLFDYVSLLNSRWFTKSILVAFSSFVKIHGGDEEDRTPDPLLAKQVLSQLSYTPIFLQGLLVGFSRYFAVPSKLNNAITSVSTACPSSLFLESELEF